MSRNAAVNQFCGACPRVFRVALCCSVVVCTATFTGCVVVLFSGGLYSDFYGLCCCVIQLWFVQRLALSGDQIPVEGTSSGKADEAWRWPSTAI